MTKMAPFIWMVWIWRFLHNSFAWQIEDTIMWVDHIVVIGIFSLCLFLALLLFLRLQFHDWLMESAAMDLWRFIFPRHHFSLVLWHQDYLPPVSCIQPRYCQMPVFENPLGKSHLIFFSLTVIMITFQDPHRSLQLLPWDGGPFRSQKANVTQCLNLVTQMRFSSY